MDIHELESERAEYLPERDVMAVINLAALTATNSATALNVLTDDSLAAAAAFQASAVLQG